MTASPLDQKSQGKDKTRQFFDELEKNLNAKVGTARTDVPNMCSIKKLVDTQSSSSAS